MDGITVGVFGADPHASEAFVSSVAKKSEAEGIAVYTRVEGGRRYAFLGATDYPDRVQGYSRIASLADHALYLYPISGKLAPPDGELAILLGAFGLPGTLELVDGASTPEAATAALRGTVVSSYRTEERQSGSSAIDLSHATPRADLPNGRTMIYVDRVFTVKGVGTVALGFVLSGRVSIHDQLRPIAGPRDLRADVKGIQVNDVDFDSAARGVRVGLSLRGVEPGDLERCRWLDDGTFQLSASPKFDLEKSSYYRQEVTARDLHVQLTGEMVPARITALEGGSVVAQLPREVPVWEGMKAAVVDLNGGALRIAGGLTSKF